MRAECPVREELLALASGQLDEELSRSLTEHADTCEACGKLLGEAHMLVSMLKSAGGSAPVESSVCPDVEAVLAYADGSLDKERSLAVERHLASCPSCLAELADVWRLLGPASYDAPEAAVERALTKLSLDTRRATVSLVGTAVKVVKDFVSQLATGEMAPYLALAPVTRAGTREPVLIWSKANGLTLDAILSVRAGTAEITGQLLKRGSPVATASVSLETAEHSLGPESLDSRGRFGPWRLSAGENHIKFRGVSDGEESEVEFLIEVETADDE